MFTNMGNEGGSFKLIHEGVCEERGEDHLIEHLLKGGKKEFGIHQQENMKSNKKISTQQTGNSDGIYLECPEGVRGAQLPEQFSQGVFRDEQAQISLQARGELPDGSDLMKHTPNHQRKGEDLDVHYIMH